MRNIAVIGCGYVGLVTGTCFAELGNAVSCIDTDAGKIRGLRAGKMPFYEPGLLELVLRNQHSGRLRFETSVADGVADAEFVFIAVGTPMAQNGEADLRFVRQAAMELARCVPPGAVVVNKSTVPVETGDLVASILREHGPDGMQLSVVSNPEFLREGCAISDFMSPDRIVLGISDARALEKMKELYAPLNAPLVITDVRTAEMIKYTANAFLAMKISFINEIANLCERVDADVKDVVAGAGADRRIGTAFLNPGLGFGGSCFPKDVSALTHIAEKYGVPSRILPAVLLANKYQIERTLDKVDSALGGVSGKLVGLLGLAFKPNTDDIRESPALALAQLLCERGALIAAHDPEAMENARTTLPPSVKLVEDAYEAANDADAMIVATDWNEYKQLDFSIVRKIMRGNTVVDARNIYDPRTVSKHGLNYIGVGRSARLPAPSLDAAIVDV